MSDQPGQSLEDAVASLKNLGVEELCMWSTQDGCHCGRPAFRVVVSRFSDGRLGVSTMCRECIDLTCEAMATLGKNTHRGSMMACTHVGKRVCVHCGGNPFVESASGLEPPIVRGALDAQRDAEMRMFALKNENDKLRATLEDLETYGRKEDEERE